MDSFLGAKEIAQFGAVGIAIALVVLFYFWYKAQEKLMAKKDKAYQDLTSQTLKESKEQTDKIITVVRKNTESSIELKTAVLSLKNALDRNSTVLERIERQIFKEEIIAKERRKSEDGSGS